MMMPGAQNALGPGLCALSLMPRGAKPRAQNPEPKAELDLRDVFRRRSLLTLHHVELHAVALGQGLEAVALDRRVMDEAILGTAIRGDEAEALRIVEPLDYALGTHHCSRVVKNGRWGPTERQQKRDPRRPGPLK